MCQCSTCRCGFPKRRNRRLYRNGDGDLLPSGGGAKHSADNRFFCEGKRQDGIIRSSCRTTILLLLSVYFVEVRVFLLPGNSKYSSDVQMCNCPTPSCVFTAVPKKAAVERCKIIIFLHEGWFLFENMDCVKTSQRSFKDKMCLLAHKKKTYWHFILIHRVVYLSCPKWFQLRSKPKNLSF